MLPHVYKNTFVKPYWQQALCFNGNYGNIFGIYVYMFVCLHLVAYSLARLLWAKDLVIFTMLYRYVVLQWMTIHLFLAFTSSTFWYFWLCIWLSNALIVTSTELESFALTHCLNRLRLIRQRWKWLINAIAMMLPSKRWIEQDLEIGKAKAVLSIFEIWEEQMQCKSLSTSEAESKVG